MTSAQRIRLARLLGMLGSEFNGERENAARLIEAFRERHGLTWAEMLSPHTIVMPESEPKKPSEPPPSPEPPLTDHDEKWANPTWRRQNAYERRKGLLIIVMVFGIGLAAVMHVF
jgi:hypothetical protein